MPRAEQQAEEQVSLSPDKILEILRREPGLLLELKKLLVKQAYEEGRILEPEDLTDEVVFTMVQHDPNFRVMATQQIVARRYIRLLPKQGETPRPQASADASAAASTFGNRQPQPPQPKDNGNVASPRSQTLLRADATQTGNANGPDASAAGISADQLPSLVAAAKSSGLLSEDVSPEQVQGMLSEAGGGTGDSAPDLENSEERRSTPPRPKSSPVPGTPLTPPKDATLRHRANPYADVPSLYDLYQQVSTQTDPLERFGMQIFRNGTGNFEQLPMDLPAGPDYVLGTGDGLKVDLWGSVSQRLQRVVDRSGRITLPEVGNVEVAGRTLGDVQHLVQAVLRTQYRDVQADVSIARIRAVRVYVVGDVQRPGAYDISSLSTPLNAVFSAGGPTNIGSMRLVRHYRSKQLVQEVDIYDLLLHGVHGNVLPMDSGDTILVPSIGPQVTVQGMVRRPAIYELVGETSLAEALELAGGVLPTGTLRHVEVERLEAHMRRTMLRLDIPDGKSREDIDKALTDFKVQDGDTIRISPILSYTEKTVFLDGHVFHPGKYAYSDGMQVADLIKSYSDLLPEPSRRHAEIIRLEPPDYRPRVISFNLADVLEHKSDLPLKPFDTIRIFGRYDFEDLPMVAVSGAVRNPGEHRTNGETHIRDAIYLAGGASPDAELQDTQVFRKTSDGKLRVISVNLQKALAGDAMENIVVQPTDRIIVHRNLRRADPPTVYVRGEVANPGRYPLAEGMTAAQLVQLAGGLKRSAFSETADLSRYPVQNGKRVVGDHQEVAIAKALSGDEAADVTLRDGDVLSIRQVAGWNDIGAAVTVKGEVLHPGTYGIREGERLSSVIRRAGGFRTGAYPQGAVLEREQVRELAEKNRRRLIERLETGEGIQLSKGALLSATTGGPSEQGQLVSAVLRQRQEALTTLKSESASGRLVININNTIGSWTNTPADLELRQGDTIFVPKKPTFVLISGQVNNATAISYTPGKNAGWYLRQAGGLTQLANKKGIFIIRANGAVVSQQPGLTSGLFSGGVMDIGMQPGDTIVVPERINGAGSTVKNLLNAAQMMSSLAIAARVATSF
jgi:protein involved in polysaccharide export with SLBB domain